MQFFDWLNEQNLLAQMMMLSTVMDTVEKNMGALATKSEHFTRDDCRNSGVTQMYRAGESESDLRLQWQQMGDCLVRMDALISTIEKRASGT